MFDRLMCWALDGSKRAKSCSWMQTQLLYERVGPNTYQTLGDWWVDTGITGAAAVLRVGDLISATLHQAGELRVHAGFVCDFASGPTYNTNDSVKASVAHDALYRMSRYHVLGPDLRDEADELFYRILRQDGMYEWRARMWFRAVREFGESAYCGDIVPPSVAP